MIEITRLDKTSPISELLGIVSLTAKDNSAAYPMDIGGWLEDWNLIDLYVMKNGKKFIGFAAVVNKAEYIYLDRLLIKASYRGRGLGKRLVQNLLNNYDHLWVFCDNDVVSFYKACGMKLVDRLYHIFSYGQSSNRLYYARV